MTKDLIARLEEAEAGSRELSDEVLLACGWQFFPEGITIFTTYDGTPAEPRKLDMWKATQGAVCTIPPSPTQSVDDALALVPAGCDWIVSRLTDLSTMLIGYTAVIETLEGDGETEPFSFRPRDAQTAATPALALCIAILTAREA